MTDYREILRLHHQGISGRDIATSCGRSRNTVARVLGKAREHGMTWRSAEENANGSQGREGPALSGEIPRLFFRTQVALLLETGGSFTVQ